MSIDNMPPHDRLCAAISIVQQHILAADPMCDPEKLFTPGGHFTTAALELAERVMMGLLNDIERLERLEKPVAQQEGDAA